MFENTPIRRKILAIVMLTSIVALLLALGALLIYDQFTYRDEVQKHASLTAALVADASSPALERGDLAEARRLMHSLRTSPHVVSAALYDEKGRILSHYPAHARLTDFPAAPHSPDAYRKEGRLHLFHTITRDGQRLGAFYMESDLRIIRDRLRIYGMTTLAVLLAAGLAAWGMSSLLQRRVTRPILDLAALARSVSARRDYSLRSPPSGNDEVGELTRAFNQMLTTIQEQTSTIGQNQEELRLTLAASRTGIWSWDLQSNRVNWDDTVRELFGENPGLLHGTFDDFLQKIYGADRMAVSYAVTQAVDQRREFVTEFRVLPQPEQPVQYLVCRGKVFVDSEGKPARVVGVLLDATASRQAEEARSFLAAIVQSSDTAIVGYDLRGRILSWNPGAEAMYGYTASEMVGAGSDLFVPHELFKEEQEYVLEALRGKGRTYETVRVRKDGRLLDVAVNLFPVENLRGEIIGFSSIARDITERKTADRELLASRVRLSGIIDSAMDAIISADEEQRITMFNSAAEVMFRCRAQDVLGKKLDVLIPERHRHAHRQHVRQFGKTGTTSRAMGHLRPLAGLRLDGEEFPIEASISHIDVGGQKIYTVILRDITERLRSQSALEEQARMLSERTELLNLANVLARDMNDKIVHWSKGMESLYGWTQQEAVGQTSSQLLKTEFPVPRALIDDNLREKGSWEGELTHTRKDGTRIHVASKWVLQVGAEDRPNAILEVNTDISARKAAEEEVVQLNAELEKRVQERTAALSALNKELESFTYSVAHDLRAPIRHIDAFSGILQDDFGSRMPPEAAEYLNAICASSRNMSRLVEDLLNLARVRRQEMHRRPVNMQALVKGLIHELQRDEAAQRVDWKVGNLPVLDGDPGLLRQVMMNLLSNSVKYSGTRERPCVEIDSYEKDGETVVFVRDNGVGFDMKYADKLFGVFQRLHRAEEFEGTGVGLAIVQRIVQKHGGRIWPQAAPNQGATFFFTLGTPAAMPEASSDEQSHAC